MVFVFEQRLRGERMTLLSRLLLIGSAIATFGACSPSSGPANVLDVSVPGAAFERVGTPASASVPFSVTNRGSASVFIARCGSRVMAALDRWNGQGWIEYSGDACKAVEMMAPLELAPGASVTTSRSVLDSGKFRLIIGTADGASSSLNWSIHSRDFEIR